MGLASIKGISKNTFVGRIVSLHRARNPHVPERTLRLLRALRLTLHPQKRIFRGALKQALQLKAIRSNFRTA